MNKHSRIHYPFVVLQFVALCVMFFGVLYYVDRPPNISDQLRFDSADRLNSYAVAPPVAEAGWRPVDFVDYENTGSGSWQSIWYRLNFDRNRFDKHEAGNKAGSRWAVYIGTNVGNVAVFLNGSFLGDGGNMEPPIPAYRRPQMFTFSTSLLKDTGNQLYVHYVRGTKNVFVQPIYIGPYTIIEGNYSKTMFIKDTLPSAILMMMAVITSIMLFMFFLRPQDKVYGWYTASTIVWIVHHAMKLVDKVPIENQHLWSAFSFLSLALFVNFGTRYLGYFTRVHYPKIEQLILWWSVVGGSVLFLLAGIYGELINTYSKYIWVPSILLTGSYGVGLLIIAFRREASTENLMLLSAIGLLFVVGIRDYLYDFTYLVPGSTFYLQFSAGFVMAFWGFIIIRRFVAALDSAEILNDELEGRVFAKTRELEVYYEQIGVIEKAKALAEERERLMRDMHDGLGGQLVHLLSLAEHHQELSPVRKTLREALRDLRLIIDSLSVSDGDLVTVLGTFRYRTEKMIKEVGLKYIWKVDNLPLLKQMGPKSALQILRILQEAVSNIMQHAEATTITFISEFQDHSVEQNSIVIIEVKDNGKGYNIAAVKSSDEKVGRGLNNMQYRAERIGAKLVIKSSAEGSSIQILIPVIQ